MGSPIIREVTIGDCLLINARMEDVQGLPIFDLGLTDPPYGIDESHLKQKNRQRKEGGNSKALANQKDYGDFDWDKNPAKPEQIAHFRAHSKHQIIFGGNYFELPPSSCWLVWDKQNGSNDFADCELAWTNLEKAVRRVYWRWNGMIRKGDDVRIHPTQKPVGVMDWCLSHVPKAKSVFDPWMGSGTTAISCIKKGLSFTGVEADSDMFDRACDRIRKAYEQADLFIPAPSKPIPPKNSDLFDGEAT